MTQEEKTIYEKKHEELIKNLKEDLAEKIEFYSYTYDEDESEEDSILRGEVKDGSLPLYPECINCIDVKILFDSCFNYKGIFRFLNGWLEEWYKERDENERGIAVGECAHHYFDTPKSEREPMDVYISGEGKAVGELMVKEYPFSHPFKSEFVERYIGELEFCFEEEAEKEREEEEREDKE